MKPLIVTVASFAAMLCCVALADDEPPAVEEKAPELPAKEVLEKRFQEALNGATLAGHFTDSNKPNEAPKEDKYTIESITKLQDDYWLFKSRIQYGKRDITLPLPLRVLWAGDTPVITLDAFPVRRLGAFTARVIIYDGRYAGTWSGHDHGGLLYGKIVKEKKAAAPAQ